LTLLGERRPGAKDAGRNDQRGEDRQDSHGRNDDMPAPRFRCNNS